MGRDFDSETDRSSSATRTPCSDKLIHDGYRKRSFLVLQIKIK